MWFLLNIIPSTWYVYFVHGVVVAGISLIVMGTVMKYIPTTTMYSKLPKLIGYIVLMFGIYFEGGYTTEMSWRLKVDNVQKQLNEANKKSKQTTIKLQKKLNAQTILIKKKAKDNANNIKKNADKIDVDCKLSDTAIELHNRASNGEVSGTTKRDDGKLSKPTTSTREDFKVK